MTAARPVLPAAQALVADVRPEADHVAGRLVWTREGQDCVDVIAAMSVMHPPGVVSATTGMQGDEGRHAVMPATSDDPESVQACARWMVLDEDAAINAVTTVASQNATVHCRWVADRSDRSALTALTAPAALTALAARIVVLRRSPEAKPVLTPLIPLLTIFSGAVTPPRQPWKPVVPFTASGAPVRCAAHRGSCSC